MLEQLYFMHTNKSLLAINSFIQQHLDSDVSSIALMKAPSADWDMKAIAAAISGYQKIKIKLPSWYATQDLIFGPSVNLEQASSEETALFKYQLISHLALKSGIDLCAGLGVDSFFLAKNMNKWTLIEADSELAARTKHNFSALQATNCIVKNDTAENYLTKIDPISKVDLIYLDPDRRPSTSQKRVFRFEDCTPNLAELLPEISQKSRYLMVKSSPMMDIQEGLALLPNAQIYVISVKNEVKELLWFVDLQQRPTHTAEIHAVELIYDWQHFSNPFPIAAYPLSYVEEIPGKNGFFILPAAGIMKAGLHKKLAFERKWTAFSHSTHLYFSEEKPTAKLPVRVFELIAELPTNPKHFRKYGLKRAQVITKNDSLKPADLIKKYKLVEAGDDFILSFTNAAKKRIMVHAKRLS